jgi:hypothetical protein
MTKTNDGNTILKRMKSMMAYEKPKKINKSAIRLICFGLMDVNQKDKIISVFMMLLELFKVTMATLLSLFVPQTCDPNEQIGINERHSCTLEENIGMYEMSNYEWFVLYWNFITLALCLILYTIMFKREKFIIEYLDDRKDLELQHLSRVIGNYPEIRRGLFKWNLLTFIVSIMTIVFYIINIIVSGIMIIRDYYDGVRTITVFVTNIVLISAILLRIVQNTHNGMYDTTAYSCIDFNPRVFNTIDPEYSTDEKEREAGVSL